MAAKSETLFHFTKSIENVKSILLNGFYPQFCLEDVRWITFNAPQDACFAYPMVCFCDIPLSRLQDHVGSYGNYGLGLTREWAIRKDISPVIYCKPYLSGLSLLANDLLNLLRQNRQLDSCTVKNCFPTSFERHLLWILSHTKPYSGTFALGTEECVKHYYQESEWRYVPDSVSPVNAEYYKHHLGELNLQMQERALRFEPEDIRYIFVSHDDDIPNIVDSISALPFAEDKKEILMTRVLSLDNVRMDS